MSAEPPKITITTRGFKHEVPCPYCKETQDFRGMEEYTEAGLLADCDDCGKKYKILSIQQTTIMKLQRICECAVKVPNKKKTTCKRCHMALP